AKAPLELVDRESGVTVTVRHERARDTEGLVADGYVVYSNALDSGGTLLYASRPDGFEDFVSFEKRPEHSSVTYEVGLGRNVRGLRLVEGTLEILDGGGAP